VGVGKLLVLMATVDTFLKRYYNKSISNVGYEIDWKPIYSKHEGTPLKTLLFLAITSFRKEAIITKFGLEKFYLRTKSTN
jgi:hypothetical protein